MVIRGGSRGEDRGQWDGWGLEEPSKINLISKIKASTASLLINTLCYSSRNYGVDFSFN